MVWISGKGGGVLSGTRSGHGSGDPSQADFERNFDDCSVLPHNDACDSYSSDLCALHGDGDGIMDSDSEMDVNAPLSRQIPHIIRLRTGGDGGNDVDRRQAYQK